MKSGLCKRALAQFLHASDVAQSLTAFFVETYSTEQGALTAEDITNAINIAFDCRPGAIAMSLALREPLRSGLTEVCMPDVGRVLRLRRGATNEHVSEPLQFSFAGFFVYENELVQVHGAGHDSCWGGQSVPWARQQAHRHEEPAPLFR